MTLGNLAKPVRSSSSRWALGSVSGGTLQPRHAALLSCCETAERGRAPIIGRVAEAQPWGSRPWTDMAAFSSMAASLSSSLARCRLQQAARRAAHCNCTPSGTLRCSVDGPVPRLALDVRSGRSRELSTITAKKPPSPPPPPPPARLSSASRRVSIRVGRQSSDHLILLPSSPIPAAICFFTSPATWFRFAD